MKKLIAIIISALFVVAGQCFPEISKLLNDAKEHWKSGRYAEALAVYRLADSILVSEGKTCKVEYANVRFFTGLSHEGLGNSDEAAKYFESALPKVEKFGKEYEHILIFLADYYHEKKDNANARRLMRLIDEHNNHEMEKECDDIECHLNRAKVYQSTGRHAQAKEEYMTIMAMPLNDVEKRSVYKEYAGFLYDQRDFVPAGDYYHLSYEASKRRYGVDEITVQLLRLSGVSYYLGKEYDKAIEYLTEVIRAVDEYGFDESLKERSWREIGHSYSAKRDYPKAIEAYTCQLEHLLAHGNNKSEDVAKTYDRIGTAKKRIHDYRGALADFDSAIVLYDRLGKLQEKSLAQQEKDLCLTYLGENGDIKSEDESQNDAYFESERSKLLSIIAECNNVLEQAGGVMGKMFNAETLGTIAGCYGLMGDYPNAVKYYEEFMPILREAIAEDFLLKSPKERELTWTEELKTIDEMNRIVQFVDSEELYTRISALAYEGQLLAKGILLTSVVEFDKVIERQGTPDMKAAYAAIKENLQRIEEMRNNGGDIEDLLVLTRDTEALQLQLAKESAGISDYTDYLRTTTGDVRRKLGKDEVAVEFVTLKAGLLPDDNYMVAIVITADNPQALTIPIAKVGELRKMAADPKRFNKEAYGIKVWAPIIGRYGDKRHLYFAPDGILHNLAIEYLLVNGAPIGTQIALSRVSSTREIARGHKPSKYGYASLFGGIDYAQASAGSTEPETVKSPEVPKKREADGVVFDYLPSTLNEVQNIDATLNGTATKAEVYTGTRASKDAFLALDRKPVNILHVATHGNYEDAKGLSDEDGMSRSILAFAGADAEEEEYAAAGIVSAKEIAAMSLADCELAVLSACESGLGKVGADGVFGLQRGFKNAGVRTMLVSLSPVADDVTAEIMIAFYKYLFGTGKTTKQDALTQAQQEIRAKYPGDDTWASFILIDALE